MRFQGVLFEAKGNKARFIERAFDVPWTYDGVDEVLPSLVAGDKDSLRLWAAAHYEQGATRGEKGLVALSAAVLDCDCTDPGTLDRVVEHLDALGLAYVVYTSWSHGAGGKVHKPTGKTGPFDCFRVVMPYSRPLAPHEHRSAVTRLYGQEVPSLADQHPRGGMR